MSVALDERFGSKKPDYKLEMKAFRGPISLKRDFRFTLKAAIRRTSWHVRSVPTTEVGSTNAKGGGRPL